MTFSFLNSNLFHKNFGLAGILLTQFFAFISTKALGTPGLNEIKFLGNQLEEPIH